MSLTGRRIRRHRRCAQRIVGSTHSTPGPRLSVLLDRHCASPVGRPPAGSRCTGYDDRWFESIGLLAATTGPQCAQCRERMAFRRGHRLVRAPKRRCIARSVGMDRRIRHRKQQLFLDHGLQRDPPTGTDHGFFSVRLLAVVTDDDALERQFETPVVPVETALAHERQRSIHTPDEPWPLRCIPSEFDAVRNCRWRPRDDAEQSRHRACLDEARENSPPGSELFHIQKPSSARGLHGAADGKEHALSMSKPAWSSRPPRSMRGFPLRGGYSRECGVDPPAAGACTANRPHRSWRASWRPARRRPALSEGRTGRAFRSEFSKDLARTHAARHRRALPNAASCRYKRPSSPQRTGYCE